MSSLDLLTARRSRDPIERLYGRAYIDLDFVRARHRLGSIRSRTPYGIPGFSFSRASDAYAQNSQGKLIAFPSGAPRLTDKGLLIEGARTNLLLRSQEFDNASWTKVRSSVTANALAAPDGTLTADKLIEDNSVTSTHVLTQAVSGNISVTNAYSVFLKAGERSTVHVAMRNQADTITIQTIFDLTTGGKTASDSGSPTSRFDSIEALADGWYRCTVGGVLNSGGGAENVKGYLFPSNGSTTSYTGDNASGLYIWGAQLEAAAGISSYIPTAGSTVTRAADVAAISGLAVSAPVTLWCEYARAADITTNGNVLHLDDNSSNNRVATYLQFSGDTVRAFMAAGGVQQADAFIANEPAVSAKIKSAARFALNDVRGAQAGSLGTQDTSATLPSAMSHLRLGSNNSAGNQPFSYLSRAAIFPRALSDAELQAITT